MKLDKNIVQRRIDLMAAEGIVRIASYLVYSSLKTFF
jgi:NADPH-dependent glutamate synthase beta subunit-like oxidoreductase